MTTPTQVLNALQQAFPEAQIEAEDSACGHGSEHFSVQVITSDFAGLSLVDRHRQVYQALQPFLQQDMHALMIQALTPAEAGQ
ncbi:BolA family protein [Anthocerotibacter panamensis]|uniref:BolA family protein n=1 Tax=Anthocerotibacter panamensis TaxID=2857077 RepID=UPI001C401B41|nr:BolA family protein [Anthocerotibacter panamensis]